MILAGLILIPFLGGLLCWQGDRFGEAPRWIALATMVAVLITALALWAGADFQLAEPGAAAWLRELRLPWIPRFGIELHLALDGLSLVLIALTGFLGILAVLCSWKEVQEGIGFFHLNLLFVLGGVVGVFLAVDLFLFFVFWEMMLVPMYFLIALWGHSEPGGKTSTYAAVKFFIYTQASGLLMLAAILALVFAHQAETGELTFSYQALLTTTLSNELALLLMLGFFIAFAVKLPVVPFHGWLPDAHAQAPTAGSVDLAGILLKTGAYGLLRFALPLFPEASAQFAPVAMGLGVLGIFYGALLACGQRDIKRLIAYTSISHMGFVLIGIYSGSTLALQGAVVLMVAHGLSAAGLFVLSGQLYERLHTRDMTRMGGLWGRLGSLPVSGVCRRRGGHARHRQLCGRIHGAVRHLSGRALDRRARQRWSGPVRRLRPDTHAEGVFWSRAKILATAGPGLARVFNDAGHLRPGAAVRALSATVAGYHRRRDEQRAAPVRSAGDPFDV